MLPVEHKIKQDMLARIRELAERLNTIRDVRQENLAFDSTYVERAVLKEVRMDSGSAGCSLKWMRNIIMSS